MSPSRQNLKALLEQAGTAYPKVVNLPNHSVEHKVNTIIRETAYQAVPRYNPGTSIIEVRSGYNTMLNQNGILSLRFQDYIYPEMAAHGVTQYSSVTLNLRDGYVYHFNQLFRHGANYQARINQIIQDQIVARQIPLLKPFAGIGPDEAYYLTPDNLVIYYQPYVYTPGYFGILEFTIPYSQISDIINPNGPIGQIRPQV